MIDFGSTALGVVRPGPPITSHRLMILIRLIDSAGAIAIGAALRLPITFDLNVFGVLPVLVSGLFSLLGSSIRLHRNGRLRLTCRSRLVGA